MTENHLAGLWTIIAMIAFLGVCFWAYSSKRREDFDEAANLPFSDEENHIDTVKHGDGKHGDRVEQEGRVEKDGRAERDDSSKHKR